MLATVFCVAVALVKNVLASHQQPLLIDPKDLHACSILEFQLPGRVSFRDSDVYKFQSESYWATNQGELSAFCHTAPRDSQELQQIMLLISQTGTFFAVKSGGHSVVANTSNVVDGIVVDLEHLNHVTVRPDLGFVDVGVGARWNDVYQKLEDTDYGVVGARAGSVGVGGYLLGGGLSPYSGVAGWACDNIVLLEVVLANGTLLEVDHGHHPDLFMALKGAGSNFGVVSRARLQLVSAHDRFDVTFIHYKAEHTMQAVHAISEYTDVANEDSGAAVSISVGGLYDGRRPTVSAVLSHPRSVLLSKVLAPFFGVGHHLVSHKRMSQLELAMMYDAMNPRGFRQHRATTTIRNDVDSLTDIVQDYVSKLHPNMSCFGDEDGQGGLLIQPLTKSHLQTGRWTNPNMLGLQEEASPLLLLSVEARHSDLHDDELIRPLISEFIYAADRNATERNASHDFRYLNYASADQFPFEHVRRDHKLWSEVQATKQKYDPHNIFGKQMRHPFKIQPYS